MKVLFLGGNGNISWHCTKEALGKGCEVYALNRGATLNSRREFPQGVIKLTADIRNIEEMKELLKDKDFDVVCDFICFDENHAKDAIELFRGKTKQYIFVSSTANYDRTNASYPLKEDCEQCNSWEYAKNKIDAEKVFMDEFEKSSFPITIVRPGQTYDTLIPDAVGYSDWTVADRIINNKPIVLFGDGTTLWTATHSKDFASAFVSLLCNQETIGKSYHITSDELLTWRQITEITADALGVQNPKIVYIPTSFIEKINPGLAVGIVGHKIWCDIYDNSKIKNVAKNWSAKTKFKDGIKESIAWLRENPSRQRVNQNLNSALDELLRLYLIEHSGKTNA